MGVLTRLRNILSARAKLITYKSAILPQLTYCHIVWNFCRSSDNRKLLRIQERALTAIYNRKSGTYDELLQLAKLPTLKNRRLQDIAILMYKVKNELCPSYIKEDDSQFNGFCRLSDNRLMWDVEFSSYRI